MTRAGPDAVAPRTLTIGTRGSKLALAQTALVQTALQTQHPHLAVAITPITTKGDVLLDRAEPKKTIRALRVLNQLGVTRGTLDRE